MSPVIKRYTTGAAHYAAEAAAKAAEGSQWRWRHLHSRTLALAAAKEACATGNTELDNVSDGEAT